MSLTGRTALVTGGSGTIGSAVCRDLDALGAAVVVADVDEAGATRVADGLQRGSALTLDLGEPGGVEGAALPAVDILVSNAGVSVVEPFVDSTRETWLWLLEVNLLAPMAITKRVLPGMMERGWGRLVYISSESARAGAGGEAAYAASKSALLGFTKSVAREAARGDVTANVVCPGPTDTTMLRTLMAEKQHMLDAFIRTIPLRRLGQPQDVAGLTAFLCTERAGFVTGQVLSVSGGITMQ
jgi:2-hydroxycyclohexanecarboxyl-CoA dehydrogenase